MAGAYRDLFLVPGSRAFFVSGVLGRISMAMFGIGIILLVSAMTGSYGIAGVVAAAYTIGSATATPIAGRLTDRHGQHPVLFAMAAGTAVSAAALIVCAQTRMPTWALCVAAAALGAASPSLGGLVRARWTYLLDSPSRRQVAYSLESVADETIFVIGPMLVAVVATGLHPAGGLAIAAVLTISGCLALGAQRGTQPAPAPRRRRAGGRDGGIVGTGMVALVVIFLLLGFVLTAVDVALVAFADESGHRAAAGPLLAIYALGSTVAGLWYGVRRWRASLARRFRAALVFLAVGLIPIVLVRDLPLMMAVVFLAGLATSPTLIPGFGLVERLVPGHRLTEGLSWLATAVRVGATAGAPVAGRVADGHGTEVAFVIPLAAAVLAAGIGVAATGALGRARPSDVSSTEPTTTEPTTRP
ncbi:MAG TPA: MFS transporter [Streptosporangiaceae bacterium]|nr:MFS transporter [Streptosporangiaceae bacterium]